jgi:hypothetical protein
MKLAATSWIFFKFFHDVLLAESVHIRSPFTPHHERSLMMEYQGYCGIGPATDFPATYECEVCVWDSMQESFGGSGSPFSESSWSVTVFSENNLFADCDEMAAYVCLTFEVCTDFCLEDVQENDFLRCGLTISDDQSQRCTITCNGSPASSSPETTDAPTSRPTNAPPPTQGYESQCRIGPAVNYPATYECQLCFDYPFMDTYSESDWWMAGYGSFADCDEFVARLCSVALEGCSDFCIENVQENDFAVCGLVIGEEFQECPITCNGSPASSTPETTDAPTSRPTTVRPTPKQTTDAPTSRPTTAPPTPKQTTDAPTSRPTTAPPTPKPIITDAPTTAVPTSPPATEKPIRVHSDAPTSGPTEKPDISNAPPLNTGENTSPAPASFSNRKESTIHLFTFLGSAVVAFVFIWI